MTPRDNFIKKSSVATVSTGLARSFVEFAYALGAKRDSLTGAVGVRQEDLANDEVRLPLATFADLVRRAKSQTEQPGLPLLFASHADFSEVSIAGLIANASETMLDALMQLNRYGRLTIDTPIDGDMPLAFERSEAADWIIDQRILPMAFPELIEISFTYLITGPRRFLPRPHVIEAQVTHEKPEHRTVYEQIWNCPVQFGARRNALRIATWVADHKVRLQPAYAFGILTNHADRMLEDLRAAETFAAQVEALIVPALHTGDVCVNWAADQLGVSRRSIYRRLKSEGTTFEEIMDSLRHRLAIEYLSARKVTVAETAYLLGYADASPFTRAFKRWTGIAPGAYQRSSNASLS